MISIVAHLAALTHWIIIKFILVYTKALKHPFIIKRRLLLSPLIPELLYSLYPSFLHILETVERRELKTGFLKQMEEYTAT